MTPNQGPSKIPYPPFSHIVIILPASSSIYFEDYRYKIQILKL